MSPADRIRTGGRAALLAVVYYAAARLGLSLAFVNAQATAVWPPTGLAIAAFLLAGPAAWPGVWLGAFAANFAVSHAVLPSLLIACGNALEGWVAASLVRRFTGGAGALERAGGVFAFAGLAGLVATMVSATIGVLALLACGLEHWSRAGVVWLTWWMGDMGGALIFAPPILLWARDRTVRWRSWRVAEAGLLVLAVVVSGLVAFGPWRIGLPANAPATFLCLPALVWAAFRFGPRETATAVALLTLLAVGGTIRGLGSFGGLPEADALLLVQLCMIIDGLSAMVIAALVAAARGEAAADAVSASRQMQVMQSVLEGMAEGVIVTDRERRHLVINREAQRILGIEVPALPVAEEELARQYGPARAYLGDGVTPLTAERSPGARAWLGETVRDEEFLVYYRNRPDGLWVSTSAKPLRDASGTIVRIVSVFRDVTARHRGELQFRGLLEAAPDGMVIVDQEGRIVLVNRQAERMFGWTKEELLGEPVERLLPERFRRGHEDHRRAFATDPHTRPMGAGLELFARRKDGTEFPCEISLSPLEAEGGRLITAAIRDITERKRVHDELRNRTEMSESLLDAQDDLDEGVAVVDARTHRFLRVNAAFCRIYGYTEAELLAMATSLEVLAPEEREVLLTRREQRRTGGAPDHFETTGLRKGGRRIRVEVAVKTLVNPDGSGRQFAIVRDVTERKRLEEVQREKERAEAASLAKSRFLATVSHELRTPLTAIIGFAKLLLRDAEDGPDHGARPYLERILDNGKSLLGEINDLLDLAKIEAGRMVVVPGPVELAPFLRELAGSFEWQARAKGLELRVEAGPGLPVLQADAGKLRRLLANLVGNALKFTDRGSVVVRADAEPRGVRIAVTDTGIGIPLEMQTLIFEPFEQVDQGQARRFEGSGLGLAICRSLADLLGARLEVDSRPGRGSTFTVRLPAEFPVGTARAGDGHTEGGTTHERA